MRRPGSGGARSPAALMRSASMELSVSFEGAAPSLSWSLSWIALIAASASFLFFILRVLRPAGTSPVRGYVRGRSPLNLSRPILDQHLNLFAEGDESGPVLLIRGALCEFLGQHLIFAHERYSFRVRHFFFATVERFRPDSEDKLAEDIIGLDGQRADFGVFQLIALLLGGLAERQEVAQNGLE